MTKRAFGFLWWMRCGRFSIIALIWLRWILTGGRNEVNTSDQNISKHIKTSQQSKQGQSELTQIERHPVKETEGQREIAPDRGIYAGSAYDDWRCSNKTEIPSMIAR